MDDIALEVVSNGTTCGASNGNISVSASGGTPPYQFAINTYPYQSSGAFAGLAAGTYTVHVMDAAGETQSATVTLTNTYDMPTLNLSGYANPTDCNKFDGSITMAASAGTPPYLYSDDEVNFQPSNVFTGLTAGDYYLFVQDAHGCQASYPGGFSLSCAGAFSFVYGGTVDACGNSGSFSIISVNSGTPPYSFSLDGTNFQPGGQFDNLAPAQYHFYIRDATGTTMVYSYTIFEYCPLILTATATDANCNATDGTIKVSVANGTSPFLYSIDGVNYQVSPTFTGLAPAIYQLWVKDASSAEGHITGIVIQSLCPAVSALAAPATCGQANGGLTLTGSSGTPPYSYSKDGINFQPGNNFNNLTAGNYTITIRDAAGQTGTMTATVPDICIIVDGAATDARCDGNNGSIIASASGGTAPYTFSLDQVNFQSSPNFDQLAGGDYTLYAKDAAGLENSISLHLNTSPLPSISVLTTDPDCNNNNGSMTINGNGGTGILQYTLNSGAWQSGNQFNGLSTGSYNAYIQDQLGCIASAPAILVVNNTLHGTAGQDTTVCEGVTFMLRATGNGNSYAWTPTTNMDNPTSPTPKVKATVTTVYQLEESLGICTTTSTVQVFVNPAPQPDAGLDTAICTGKSVMLQGNGGLDYRWHPADYLSDPDIANPTVINPPQSMTYWLSVTDANGCASLQEDAVNVQVISTTKVFAGRDTVITKNESLQLQAIDVNNSGFTQYVWTPATGLNDPYIADPVTQIDQDITYQVTATAPGGCTGTAQVSIKIYAGPEIYVPNAFTPDDNGHNDVLKPFPVGIKQLSYFAVFNRWGQRTFYSEDAARGWDGTLQGVAQPNGGYVWIAAGIDFQGHTVQRKGTVLLIR